jgi:hypothetical protein
MSSWDDIPTTHRYVIPERFKVYQFRAGLETYPDFIYDATPRSCGTQYMPLPYVMDGGQVIYLDEGDWIVLGEDEYVSVYGDADFREHFEEDTEEQRLIAVLTRAEELLMLRLEKPYHYPLEECLQEVHDVVARGLKGEHVW